MSMFKSVTPGFAVASQLTRADFAAAKAAGFRTIINNRPNGEAPDQLSDEDARAAAAEQGLNYMALPFVNPPPPGVVAAFAEALETAQTPVLAYCRSGTRSVTAWALAQALAGEHKAEDLVKFAAGAGYDLSGLLPVLQQLAPKA